MAATITKSPALKRVERLIHEVEQAIPVNNLAARASVELLLNRLTAKLPREMKASLRHRDNSSSPRKPR